MLPAEDLFVYVYVLTDDLIAAQIIAIPRRLACLARMVWLFWAAHAGGRLGSWVSRFRMAAWRIRSSCAGVPGWARHRSVLVLAGRLTGGTAKRWLAGPAGWPGRGCGGPRCLGGGCRWAPPSGSRSGPMVSDQPVPNGCRR